MERTVLGFGHVDESMFSTSNKRCQEGQKRELDEAHLVSPTGGTGGL